MPEKSTTVDHYLATLPDDRRAAVEAIRKVILKNLPKGFQEGISYGMIGYSVPHSLYPAGYHCDPKLPLPFACLASQKDYMSLYLFGIYSDPEAAAQFQEAWTATGRRLDMGKSCIRFRKLEDVPLDVLGRTIKQMTVKKFIAKYEEALSSRPAAKSRASKTTTKKAGRKKSASKKAASRGAGAARPGKSRGS